MAAARRGRNQWVTRRAGWKLSFPFEPVLKKQIERVTPGLDAAEQLLAEFNAAKRRPGRRMQAEQIRFAEAAAKYLVA